MHLILDVSVDVRVPEQGLVSVTPEKLLLSQVLVLVLSWPFFVWDLTQVRSVLSMVQFGLAHRNGCQENGWQGNKVGDFQPQVGDTFGVVNLFLVFLDESFTGLFVVSESILLDQLRHMAVAMRVVSHKGTLGNSSEHVGEEDELG